MAIFMLQRSCVIDSLVMLGFQIYKVEGQGFFSYSVTDVENVSNFMFRVILVQCVFRLGG